MDAVTYEALDKAEYASIADPEPAADDLIIRMKASGICHTDIDILHGRYGSSRFPLVPGHEYAGEIVAKGVAVDGFAIGDHVVVDPNFHCGTCRPCRKGLTNLCENLGAYGVTRNGGFADYSAVNQKNIVGIGSLSFEVAALAEPVGCVLNGLGAVDIDRIENTLIFGAGPIGLLMALTLRTRGIADITMVDLDESRLALAETFQLNAIAAGSRDLEKYSRSMDLVVDATGVIAVAQGMIDYAANGGNVLFFGVCPPGKTIQVSPQEIFRRQLRLAGAHSLNHNIPEALETIAAIGPGISRLISHRLPLRDIVPFLGHERPSGSLKVMAVNDE
ncbi:MAG TPA: zinc-dependent alcohol dehydrogenase family protein [Aurantimonas sp.]|uniref:Zinc-dependent alcohol dehydrogenase family protein n=1 Tax=Aurantimonas marianensis TaxID=2920428 RepID=A0A9X2KIP4_9HYPH|nr:zinc-dependent alcohol dehydrogenase family protein [Aurantimonas marianensis]MCP3055812.1 zinc-dependent alcohol dehydrogenase family protein [Aurantimonas marianensis]